MENKLEEGRRGWRRRGEGRGTEVRRGGEEREGEGRGGGDH